ncbi:MAG: cyclic nucleotide-binding domain-containing protein [Deltaproteobacteria bacterium]|jgi:CRP-like cAMP-binding protein
MLEVAHRIELELLMRTFLGMEPPDRVMRQLASVVRDFDAPPGTVLYERGDPPGELFMIADGTVALIGEDGSRWVFEGQSLVGVLDSTLDRPMTRRAVVETRAHGARLMLADYLDVLDDNFDFAKTAMERGCRMVHENALALAPDHVFPPPSEDPILDERGGDPRPLEMVERLMVLHRSSLFDAAPLQPLASLAALAEEERWEAGDVIERQGETSMYLRCVASGSVCAERDDPRVVADFGPSDVVAGIAALGLTEAGYTIRATRPTRTLKLLKEDLFDVAEDHFGLMGTFFRCNGLENERIRNLGSALDRVD